MQKKDIKKQQGFTLIEILVVIGMIALLAAIVIVAINPARQFAQGRNTQRTSNVNTILNAIGQNIADNKGIFTCKDGVTDVTFSTTKKYICDGTTCKNESGASVAAGEQIDLGCLTPTYVSALPFDPNGSDYYWTGVDDYNTGYTVELVENSRVKVCAAGATKETAIDMDGDGTFTDNEAICVTR